MSPTTLFPASTIQSAMFAYFCFLGANIFSADHAGHWVDIIWTFSQYSITAFGCACQKCFCWIIVIFLIGSPIKIYKRDERCGSLLSSFISEDKFHWRCLYDIQCQWVSFRLWSHWFSFTKCQSDSRKMFQHRGSFDRAMSVGQQCWLCCVYFVFGASRSVTEKVKFT